MHQKMLHSSKFIIFVIAQAGAFAFCTPLWRKWLQHNPGINWSVLASPDVLPIIHREKLEKTPIIEGWEGPKATEELIDPLRPELIISSATGHQREKEATSYANANTISYLQFVDTLYNYTPRIRSSNQEGMLPSRIILIDNEAKEEAIRTGLPAERIEIVGHPGWEAKLGLVQNTQSRKKIAFASQPISEIPALDHLGYNEEKVWDFLLEFQKTWPETIDELVYYPHPAQKHLPSNFPPRTRLAQKHENPLTSAGTLISMYSAIMIEAHLAGLHVISLQPGLKTENLCLLSRKNYIPLVTNNLLELKTALETSPLPKQGRFAQSLKGSLERFENYILNSI